MKKIDDTNKAIIKQLRDGRKAFSAIAEELGISRATLFRRLKAAKKRKISEISVYDTRKD